MTTNRHTKIKKPQVHFIDVLHSFSIKNIFYDKMNLRFFLFSTDEMKLQFGGKEFPESLVLM